MQKNVNRNTTVYTDDSTAYSNLPFNHDAVRHSVGEYVKEQAHINGVESFWAILKRAHKGTFHKNQSENILIDMFMNLLASTTSAI